MVLVSLHYFMVFGWRILKEVGQRRNFEEVFLGLMVSPPSVLDRSKMIYLRYSGTEVYQKREGRLILYEEYKVSIYQEVKRGILTSEAKIAEKMVLLDYTLNFMVTHIWTIDIKDLREYLGMRLMVKTLINMMPLVPICGFDVCGFNSRGLNRDGFALSGFRCTRA